MLMLNEKQFKTIPGAEHSLRNHTRTRFNTCQNLRDKHSQLAHTLSVLFKIPGRDGFFCDEISRAVQDIGFDNNPGRS